MKKNVRRTHTDQDLTEEIRTTLTFLQFIENKIINKQVYRVSSLDMKEIDNFAELMSLCVK